MPWLQALEHCLPAFVTLLPLNIEAMPFYFSFVAVNLGFLAYEWFVLEHSWIIFIAYASSLIFTVGSLVIRNTHTIRKVFLVAETLGLLYAISVGSIFGTVFNVSNLISILSKLRKP